MEVTIKGYNLLRVALGLVLLAAIVLAFYFMFTITVGGMPLVSWVMVVIACGVLIVVAGWFIIWEMGKRLAESIFGISQWK